ncbi:MAG: T9SS type A sorting domain-containing protein [Candidatus Cloacimonetes bacterium]|nr:T9SS type A sorting domain-containing protein [Candidatus Cloacimonadota bacterium]
MKSIKQNLTMRFLLVVVVVLIASSINSIFAQTPILSVEPEELSFGEVELGETVVLSYTLTGSDLVSNVYLHSTMGYLISLDEETGYQQNLMIPEIEGEVSATIYVKFAPLFPRDYNGRVRNRTTGFPDQLVLLTGTGIIDGEDLPELTITPQSLYFGEVQIGDEAIQSYTLTGTNLISNVIVNAPLGYLLSLDEQGDFLPQLIIEPSDSELSEIIFVKFVPFFPREYNRRICHRTMGVMGEFLWVYGTGVLDAEFPPVLSVFPDSLYFGEVLVGDEAILSYNLTGENLLAEVLIRAPRGYLVSLDEDGEFLPILSIEPLEGNVSETVYVKFAPLYERNYFSAVRNRTIGIMGTPVRVRGVGVLEEPGSEPLLNVDTPITQKTDLIGNYPNPFNPDTNISYYLEEAGFVTIEIYNSRGQRVKTLVNGYADAGEQAVYWNGKDEANRDISSGIYFYRMKKGTFTSTKKMILMK